MYAANVLADSIAHTGVRLTTYSLVFPRFLLPEFMTHRMFSRNFASSRAIPTERLLTMVRDDPFTPQPFNARVKGMGVGKPLPEDIQRECRYFWQHAAENAAHSASMLMSNDVDKSRVNRLIEPFLWVAGVVTATEWDNFYALRAHPDAQPEFQTLANLMRETRDASTPQDLAPGDWHLPLLTKDECKDLHDCGNGYIGRMKLVSAGRCARYSFWNHDKLEPQRASIERALKLLRSGHLSPFEHIARPWSPGELSILLERQLAERTRCAQSGQEADQRFLESLEFTANFRKWEQFRREFPFEHRFDQFIALERTTA